MICSFIVIFIFKFQQIHLDTAISREVDTEQKNLIEIAMETDEHASSSLLGNQHTGTKVIISRNIRQETINT